jgi:hypothetical protein
MDKPNLELHQQRQRMVPVVHGHKPVHGVPVTLAYSLNRETSLLFPSMDTSPPARSVRVAAAAHTARDVTRRLPWPLPRPARPLQTSTKEQRCE